MKRLLSFRHWPILPKIMAISVVSIAVTCATVLFYFAPRVHQRLLALKAEGAKNVVDVAIGVFVEYDALARSGAISIEEAQARAAAKLRSTRYGEKEYLWVNDVSMRMLVHPTRELEGKDVSGWRDPNGKYLFREFVEVCRARGSGVVSYLWPKPGETVPVPKISYVRLYEPWGWILGSGVYVDDVDQEMDQLRSVLVLGMTLFCVFTLTLAGLVGARITRPLKSVICGLQDIARGKGDVGLSRRIAITSIDEIGLLSSEFNSLMESIATLSAFKKVIEEEDAVEDVYRRLGEALSSQVGFPACRIWAVGEANDSLARLYPVQDGSEGEPCDAGALERSDLCKAKRTGHSISSFAYPDVCRRFHGGAGRHHCCLPLVVDGAAVAVVQLVLEPDEEGRSAAADRTFRAEQYIKEALPVVQMKRLMATLRDATLHDPLTGLHNRRYLQECTEAVIAGALRRGKGIGVVMCDLDHFKRVNDDHGHHAGDVVLKEVARVLAQSVRSSDIVVRLGGEEFLVVLVDVAEDDLVAVAEKLRARIEETRLELPEESLRLTASFGVAALPMDADGLWKCVELADLALYEAKTGGRNRVVRCREPAPTNHVAPEAA